MVPLTYRVQARTVETRDSATLRLEPTGVGIGSFRPGQFTMLAAPGVGEIAISISGDPAATPGVLEQTIRDVGAVSAAIQGRRPGDVLGVRGPFGTDWGLDTAAGQDLLIVAGGVGLAPLRPVILAALGDRQRYGRITVVAGARSPDEFLFCRQLDEWIARDDIRVEQTVDLPAAGWAGTVGFVTEPLKRLPIDPAQTIAFVCGPEPMMRFSARVLTNRGLADNRIRVSLERNMNCGIALCGHCQLGPLLVCRDGPVIDYGTARRLFATREL